MRTVLFLATLLSSIGTARADETPIAFPMAPSAGLGPVRHVVLASDPSDPLGTSVRADAMQTLGASVRVATGAPVAAEGLTLPTLKVESLMRSVDSGAEAAREASALGADLLVDIRAVGTVEDSPYTEEREVRTSTSNGGEVKKVPVDCVARIAVVTTTFTVYDGSGQQLRQVPVRDTATSRDCDEPGDDKLVLGSATGLFQDAVRGAHGSLNSLFAIPAVVLGVEVGAHPGDDEVRTLLITGKWDAALDRLAATQEDLGRHAEFWAQVGAALLGAGQYDSARVAFDAAERLGPDRFEKARAAALARPEQLPLVSAAVGATWQARSMSDVPEGAAVLVEGARALLDRTNPAGSPARIKSLPRALTGLHTEPSPRSEEVAEVRRGLRVFVGESEGRFVFVSLVTGESGWVPKARLSMEES